MSAHKFTLGARNGIDSGRIWMAQAGDRGFGISDATNTAAGRIETSTGTADQKSVQKPAPKLTAIRGSWCGALR